MVLTADAREGVEGARNPDNSLRICIERCVAPAFGVADEELRRPTRGRARTAFARQAGMYLAHVALRLDYTSVGSLFRRDRTTVAHACALIEDRRDDPRFDRVMDLLETIVVHLRAHDLGRERGS